MEEPRFKFSQAYHNGGVQPLLRLPHEHHLKRDNAVPAGGDTYPAQIGVRHVNISVPFFIEFWAQEALRAGAFGHSKIDENSVSYDSGE